MPATMPQDLEAGVIALCRVFKGSQFVEKLIAAHAVQTIQIPLRVPFETYFDEIKTPDGYPCCEVVPLVSIPHGDGGQGEVFEHEISVHWTVNGDNEQQMSHELLRLMAACRALFFEGHLQPYVGGIFRCGRSDYGPTAQGKTFPFVKSAALQLFWRTAGYGL